MKNNWLGVLLGVSCAFFSSFAFSLGLGSITSDSAINEPLIAEIELINVGDLENTQILVGIGTDSDYELASVTREFFHSDLQFEVQVESVGQPRILVRTRQPLQDPYLNFVVQVRWPQGKLLREYTLLLDMPVFSRQEAANNAPLQSTSSAPTTARQAAAQQAQQTNRQTTTSASQPSAVGSSSNLNAGQAYRVSAGDTLWALAGDIASSTATSRHQAMLSLHEQNPNAFVNGDINRLRADAELRVPSEAQMSSRTEGQALRDFSSLAQDASASPIQSSANSINRSVGAGDSAQGGRLALTSTSGSNNVAGDASSTADVAAQQAANDALSLENATLKEQLDASEIERQELQDRLANLEEQLNLLEEERVLQIENEDLAAVQQAMTATDDAEDQAAAPIVTAPEPQPETLMDKLNAFRYWIFGGLAIILVIALLVVLLVLRQRKSSEVDELYYDDEQDADDLDEDEDYLNAEDGDEELDEGIDEITKELSDEDDEDEFEEDLEDEDLEDEDLEDEDPEDEATEEDEEPLFAASFDEAEEEGEEAFESDEFEDLDEFFSGESSGATEVLFGSDDKQELEVSSEDELDVDAEESDSDLEEDTLEYSVEDLNVPEEAAEEAPEVDDENSLEFEIGDMDLGGQDEESEAEEIDLEDKFDYVESGITEDLGADAEADFEESIEVHSSDMNELLVPSDEDEDELFIGESPEAAGEDLEADDNFVEDMEEDLDSLLDEEGQVQDEESEDSLLDVDEDLNLDEDMDADLDDLDLGEDDLEAGDSDEEFLTKLELAEAYIEMGDVHGAKELLSEVEKDGNAEQQAAAKSMREGIKG